MKVDFTQQIKTLDGSPYMDDGKALTLGVVCTRVLSLPLEMDKELPGDKALHRWKLAIRIHSATEEDISPEDITLIRSRLTRVWAVFVAGQAYEMLEGK